jgi:hypothetical protein
MLWIVILLIPQFSQAQYIMKIEGGQQPYKPQPISGTPILNTPELMSYLKSLGGDVFAKSLKKPLENDLGTVKNFYVNNMETNTFESVEFKLLAKGTLAQVWCSTAELSNGHLTQAVADTFLLYLENKSGNSSVNPNEGIIAIDQQYFGQPPDKDGDGLVDALLTDIKDGWEPGSSSGYVAGFFYSMDQTNISGKSNKADIIYLDSYPGIYYSGVVDPNGALQTIAHEYQHLIHFNYDQNEYTFVNEGLSENAEYITGLYTRSAYRYLSNVNVPIFRWDRSDALPDYSRTSLFFNYIGDRFGVENYKYYTQNPLAGPAGINAALENSGYSGVILEDVIHDFHIANLVNDRTVDEKYGYINPARKGLNIPEQYGYKVFSDAGNTGNISLMQGGAGYLTFDNIDIQEATFTFPANIKVSAVVYQADGSVSVKPVYSGMTITLSGNNDEIMSKIQYVISNTQPSGNENTYTETTKISWEINGAKSFHYQTLSTYNPVAKFSWGLPYYNSSGVGRLGFTNKYTMPEDGYLSQMKLYVVFGIDGSTGDTIKIKGEGQMRLAVFNDDNGLPGSVLAEDTLDFSEINVNWNSFNIDSWNLFLNEGDIFHAYYEFITPKVDTLFSGQNNPRTNVVPLRLDDGGGEQNVSKIITSPENYTDMFTDDETHGQHAVWNEIVYKVIGQEAPRGLKAVSGDKSVQLTWAKSYYKDFKMYRIYGGETEHPVTLIDSVMNSDTTAIIIKGLTNGQKYYFRMTVVNTAGIESDWSAEVNAKPMSRAFADIELGVLQNPVFTEYIDIFLSSNETLDPTSVAASLKQGGSSRGIGLVNKDGTNKVFQNTKIKLQAEGDISIIAKVKLPFSVSETYDTLAFTTKHLSKQVDNLIKSFDQTVRMKIRKNSIKSNFTMLVIPVKSNNVNYNEIDINNEKYIPVSDPLFFSPYNREFDGEIQWEYKGEEGRNIFITKVEDNEFSLIATRFDDKKQTLSANVAGSGKYILLKSLSGKENMTMDIPNSFTLAQNYPNPFNPQTTIKFSLPKAKMVRLEIFNMLGQKVRTLINAELPAGYYHFIWNGKNTLGESVSSGIYFYRLQAGDSFSQIKKMTLIR